MTGLKSIKNQITELTALASEIGMEPCTQISIGGVCLLISTSDALKIVNAAIADLKQLEQFSI